MPITSHLAPEFALWLHELPAEFEAQAIAPARFEVHHDAPAHARMVVGWDAEGQRCYLRHSHTVVAEGFDADEWPLTRPLMRVNRVAWRIVDGRWLSWAQRVERLESCQPRHLSSPPELAERPLGF